MALPPMQFPDFYGTWSKARQNGEQRATNQIVSRNIQGALGGDQNALGAILKASPNAGMQLQQYATQQQAAQRQQRTADLGEGIKLAKGYLQTRDPGLARALLPHLKQLHPELPDNALDLPGADEGLMKAAQALASLDTQTQEQFTLSPGSKRFDASGRVLAEVPFAPANLQYVDVPDGTGGSQKMLLDPRGGQFRQPNFNGGGGVVMDQALIDAVIQQESGGNPNAVSSAGAQGLMQLMPETARDPGFGVTPARDGSPQENVRVGSEYLQAMLKRYNGNLQLALAAYNAGPGRVDQAMGSAGGDPQRAIATLPQETQNYVPSVQRRMGYTPPKANGGKDAPSGYQWSPDGQKLIPIPGGPADRKNNPTASDQAKGEMAMRKELEDRTKQPRIVLDMYKKVETAANQPSAPNDLALIFAYMKMLDPGSVVREQEFANAQNAAGVPDRIRNAYNKALRGERLNEAQRGEFVGSARQIASIAQNDLTTQTRQYQGIAEQYGYDTFRASGAPDFRNVNSGTPQQAAPSNSGSNDASRQALLDKY